MFSTEDLDRILFAPVPAPPPHTAVGHSDIAEGFRLQALTSFATARIMWAHLESILRDSPSDDARFDELSEGFMQRVHETGLLVNAFRDTRDIAGSA